MKNTLVLGLFLISTLLIWGCKELVAPDFKKMTNVKFSSIMMNKGVNLNITADALLNNPNSIGANVSKIDFDIFIDGIKVSNITQNVSKKMPANSDFTLPLNFSVPLQKVFAGFKPTIADMLKKRTVKIKMIGHIYIKQGIEIKVPVDFDDSYGVPLKYFLNM